MKRIGLAAVIAAVAVTATVTVGASAAGSADAPGTFCGYGESVQDTGRVNVYRLRIPTMQGVDFHQACFTTKGGTNFRIDSVPHPKSGNRYGYVTTFPSIMDGCLHGFCTPHSVYPVRVSKIRTEYSSVKTVQGAAGTWDAAYDDWFGTKPQTNGHPDAAELMIWINHHGACCFLANNAVRLRIGGRQWILTHWRAYDRKMKIGWNYIQFRLVHPRWAMKYINIKSFIQIAVNRGLLKRWWYQLTSSFGYEVWNGAVGNRLLKFRDVIRRR